ncbi:uncharacterized protein OCT59_018891 [Rhizophagus irregularis]|uniref:HTH myb-type domain-containing protein n=2 Tax=Rhizophagus irregularis TaxID=588596 RepID=U9U4X8_RHIID|nr:hypothetical protein GLOIN_2v1482553 [Rhizophagus irregularis DAOM 181602=DAOM 197198]EXX77635.1 hypothetical protein RirG_022050 [Rhizophagus irregularis DAOM 197198w]UZO26677.1 hypothetical protein OCT59_018891 [Rhizophagus irregularis]POG66193.1 hypothetical protein GLOIN_2v1482553 [Rhizophagus irregularis DAOM 181602=DAOM 197198]CAG8734560.1 1388_t:CDS:2 [Rhizophagus irregularis]GBC34272.2 hypothetical protein GLOIN_2v1482553 [Rhizophagus irregularis DAOM 181602=DAOM 197198]|eukprot:XP_025173059.1 hypothetical protein GLOIN_2v1482553 [Rhizophagus irregularis DAOM 181602=DAOM 197198]
MADQRVYSSQEYDNDIEKYMKEVKDHPKRFTLVSKQMGNRISSKKIRQRWINKLNPSLCHDPLDEEEKSFINKWVENYKSQNPSADKIPWSKLILVMKEEFGKLRSENKVKNYWHPQQRQRERNTSQGPFGINHDTQSNNSQDLFGIIHDRSNNDQGSSEIKKDPRMEISHLIN